MDGWIILTLSSCPTQARGKNFFPKMVVFCGLLGVVISTQGRDEYLRDTSGTSRNVLDEVTLKNVCLVARAR